jgi:hypothetical protein
MMRARWVAVWVSFVACSGSPPGKPVQPVEPVPVAQTPVAPWAPPADDDPVCKPSADEAVVDDRSSPEEAIDDGYSGRRKKAKNACSVADESIARLEKEVAAGAPAKTVTSKAWDGKAKLSYTDIIARRFALTKPELAALEKNRVVVPARLEMPSYVHAYHEVFQSQLPVYITADSIFHAVFASHDDIVGELETSQLMPLLAGALDKMHCALAGAVAAYPHDVARDVDLYLTVARSLANGDAAGKLGDATLERDVLALLAKINAAAGVEDVELFGRTRAVDFTQYTPRGHYTQSDELKRFFQLAMWASRLELNLVSRDSRSSVRDAADRRETPREALVALALVDLAERAGAMPAIEKLDRAWQVLAGKREDVSFTQLAALRTKAGIKSLTDATAFDALKKAIGGDFKRTTRIHVMPEGVAELPAIATLLGPRIVADAHAVMPLVHDAVPDRHQLRVADVAYAMGLDHAKSYLAADLARFPSLERQLEAARKTVASASGTGDDLYSAWYGAIRALATRPAGSTPSYLATRVGQDLRLNSIAAAYGQLKHNYVLVAGQPYSSFGCEIPDGYVEPVVEVYDRLIEYTRRGGALAAMLSTKSDAKAYFERAGAVLKMLRGIAADELADRPLTASQKNWLGMVAELTVNTDVQTTGYPPMYTGWYFDLFYQRESGGMRNPSFIADYFTSKDGIAYAGAGRPRMAVFVVDTGGGPRAMVGPVASAYEVFGPLATRYSDETAAGAPKTDAWAASYTLAAPAAVPSLKLSWDPERKGVVIEADAAHPSATVRTLDHHRVPLQTQTRALVAGENFIPFGRVKDVNAVYLGSAGSATSCSATPTATSRGPGAVASSPSECVSDTWFGCGRHNNAAICGPAPPESRW